MKIIMKILSFDFLNIKSQISRFFWTNKVIYFIKIIIIFVQNKKKEIELNEIIIKKSSFKE